MSHDNDWVHPQDLPQRPASTRVLMADPSHFDVTYVINPHMADNVGNVDRDRAIRQWEALRPGLPRSGVGGGGAAHPGGAARSGVHRQPVVPDPAGVRSAPGHPVEHARPPAKARGTGGGAVVRGPGVGAAEDRRREHPLPRGWGDANWHPGRRLIYGGYGWRTTHNAYTDRHHLVDAPIVPLELVDVRLYHLDTCFSPLDESTAVICPEAFTPEALATLGRCFDRLIPSPIDEAIELLACNGHCPDGKHFIVQAGAHRTVSAVAAAGYEVIEVDTSEFLKSGGSVQCLKLMLD